MDLPLRGGDLFAEHRAQAGRDRLIEIRAHGEVRMMQRAREPRLDVEIRDAGDGLPDQTADRAVRETGVARPPHVRRADGEPRPNGVAVQREAELRGAGARIERERHAGDVESGQRDAADTCARGVDRNGAHMIERRARGELRSAGLEGRRPAIQCRIARQPGQPAGVALRLFRRRVQQERELGSPDQKRRQRALFGKTHVFARAPHAARAGRGAGQQPGRHVATRQLHVVEDALERLEGGRRKQRGPDLRCIKARQLQEAARERVVAPPQAVEPGEPRLQFGDARPDAPVQRRHAVARALETVDRLTRSVEGREIGGARMPQRLERRARGIERRSETQRIERRPPGAAGRVRPRAQRGGGGNRGQPPRIERVDADLPGR